MRLLGRFAAITVAACLALTGVVSTDLPAYAAGGNVTVSGSTITYNGTTARDAVTLDTACAAPAGGSCVRLRAAGFGTVQPPCTASTTSVVCPLPGKAIVGLNLGAGDDAYATEDNPVVTRAWLTRISVNGGPGNDTLYGAGPTEYLLGSDGNDRLTPDADANSLNVGFDYLSGGLGADTVDYRVSAGRYVSGVGVSLDAVNNDGTRAAGDVDNVSADIETFYLTSAADVFTGDDAAQRVYGVEGDDVLSAVGGADTVDAGPGVDRVDGGTGNDSLIGGSGDDTTTGGPGLDKIWGDTADPAISGNDVILSRDQEADHVSCGPGADHVEADAMDLIIDACEAVFVEAPPPPIPLTAVLDVPRQRLDANRKRKAARLRLSCSGGLPCAGRVLLKSLKGKSRRLVGKGRLGQGRYAVAPDSQGRAKVRLDKDARRLLRKTRKAKVRVVITIDATRATVRAKLVLKR